jgi:hypothetical protein
MLINMVARQQSINYRRIRAHVTDCHRFPMIRHDEQAVKRLTGSYVR